MYASFPTRRPAAIPKLDIQLRFALKQGWTEEKLTEVLLHFISYVGAPITRDAMVVASEVFEKVKAEAAE